MSAKCVNSDATILETQAFIFQWYVFVLMRISNCLKLPCLWHKTILENSQTEKVNDAFHKFEAWLGGKMNCLWERENTRRYERWTVCQGTSTLCNVISNMNMLKWENCFIYKSHEITCRWDWLIIKNVEDICKSYH